MIRFNYLAKSHRPLFGAMGTVAIDNRIRGPLAVLLGTVVLSGLLSIVQLARLHAAEHAYATATIRLAADEPRLNAVKALRSRVLAAARLIGEVNTIRRASLAHANELAWIGNRLPSQTWLAALRYEAGTYSLEGTSDRPSAVGAAMIALHDEAHAAIPQLVSLHDQATTGAERFRYSLKLQTQR